MKKYTYVIKDWLYGRIRKHHIEEERIWREIVSQDILDALDTGEVIRIRESDHGMGKINLLES